MSSRKLKAFAVVNLVFFACVLLAAGAAELGLRAAGFRFSLPLLEPLDKRAVLEPAGNGLVRIAPDLYDGAPYGYPFMLPEPAVPFSVVRKPGTLRIVFVGDSSGHWFNGAKLDLLSCLGRAQPKKTVEYINLSFAGCGSERTLPTAREALALHPDVMIVSTGHSNFVSHCNPAAFKSAAGPVLASYSPLFIWSFRNLRLVQALAKALTTFTHDHSDKVKLRINSLDVQRTYDAAAKEEFYASFRADLNEILEEAKKAGVPVILHTMAYNYSRAPMWDAHGDYELRPALELPLAELRKKVDEGKAGPVEAYALGRRLWDAKRTDEGRKYMDQAYADSLRPFTATTITNGAIRELASAHSARLVDVKALIDEASPRKLADDTLMADHCHLNLAGNRLVAERLCQVIPTTAKPSGN